jgi:hypothetical protein
VSRFSLPKLRTPVTVAAQRGPESAELASLRAEYGRLWFSVYNAGRKPAEDPQVCALLEQITAAEHDQGGNTK